MKKVLVVDSDSSSESSSEGGSKFRPGKPENLEGGRKVKHPLSQRDVVTLCAGLPSDGIRFRCFSAIFKQVTRREAEKTWQETLLKLTRDFPVKSRWKPYTDEGQNSVVSKLVKLIDVDYKGKFQVVDVGCGCGELSLAFAEAIDATNLVQLDVQDWRSAHVRDVPQVIFRKLQSLEEGGLWRGSTTVPTIVLFSMALHHMPPGTLEWVQANLPAGSYILIREHNMNNRVENDAACLHFTHWLYDILEDKRVPWQEYDTSGLFFYTMSGLQKLLAATSWDLVHSASSPTNDVVYLGARNFSALSHGVKAEVLEPEFKDTLGVKTQYPAKDENTTTSSSTTSGTCPPIVPSNGGPSTGTPPTAGPTPPGGGGGTNPAPPLLGQPAPDAGPNAPPVLVDLRTYVKSVPILFSPVLPPTVQAIFRMHGCVVANSADGCAHPATACYRKICVRSVLKRMIPPDVREFTILDYFGGERNRVQYRPKDEHLRLTIQVAPEIAIAGDSARGFLRTVMPKGFDSFLVQDVYQDGATFLHVLQPSILLELCHASRRGWGYVIIRQFEGLCGQDSDLYDEGLWHRDLDNIDLVHFSPDPTGVSYALHPAVEWIFKYRSYQGLAIADVAHFGPYKVFCVSPDFANAIALSNAPLSCGSNRVVLHRFENPESLPDYLWNRLRSWFPSILGDTTDQPSEDWVDSRIYAAKGPLYAGKVTTPQQRDAATSAVHTEFAMTAFYKRLQNRFPAIYMKIIMGTSRAVLYGLKAQTVIAAEHDVKTYGDLNSRLHQARAGSTPDSGITWQEYGLAGVALVVLLIGKIHLMRHIRPANAIGAYRDALTIDNVQNFGPRLVESPSKASRILSMAYEGWINGLPGAGAVALQIIGSFFDTVIWSPLFEETGRVFFPRATKFLTMVIEPVSYAVSGQYIGAALSLMFHLAMTALTPERSAPKKLQVSAWTTRVTIHAAWNLTAWVFKPGHMITLESMDAAAQGRVPDYSNIRFIDAPICPMSVSRLLGWFLPSLAAATEYVHPLSAGDYWPAVSGHFVPVQVRECVEKSLRIEINGEQTTLLEAANILDQYSHEHYNEQNRIYPMVCVANEDPHDSKHGGILSHSYPFVRPSSSPINLLNCLAHRVWSVPAHTPVKGLWAQVHKQWREVVHYPFQPPLADITFLEAISKMDRSKWLRLYNADRRCTLYGSKDSERCSASVKHNEVLWAKPAPLVVKPRCITQLEAETLARTAVINKQMAQHLHDIMCPGNVYYVPHYTGATIAVTYIFASGYTAADLNLAFARMLASPDITFYMVSGDDNLLKYGSNPAGLVGIGEGDFRMYDSTQTEDALKESYDEMVAAGVDPEVARLECDISGQNYAIILITKDIKIRIVFVSGWQRRSGDGATTWGNSGINSKSGNHYVHNMGRKTFTECCAELGLDLKFKLHSDPGKVTFLKGWFCVDTDGAYHWLPLPSMILKLGKLLRHPSDIFPGVPVDEAYRKALYAMASSPGYIPFEYPLLGPFIAMMKRVGIENDIVLEHKKHRISVNYFSTPLNVEDMTSKICERYDLEPYEIDDFHLLLDSVVSLPVLLVSPVTEKLGSDYA